MFQNKKKMIPIITRRNFSKSLVSLLAFCLTFLAGSCGSGGGNNSSTVRPLTMNGLVIITPQGDRFEFLRSLSSNTADNFGDTETGTFFYTSGGTNIQTYPSASGEDSDVRFPDEVNSASYTYQALGDSEGILTLTGVAVNDLFNTGFFGADNGSFVYFFEHDSSGITTGVNTRTVVIDISFTASGSFITDITTTWTIPNSLATNPLWDTVFIPCSLFLETGGTPSAGHTSERDPDDPSRLVPDTLDGLVFDLNDTLQLTPDVAFQFSTDPGSGTSSGNDVDETGTLIERLGGIGSGTAVISEIDYSASRISGTDSIELTISGGGNDRDGTYTLIFSGADSGTVQQTTGSGVLLNGDFFVFDEESIL